MQGGDQRTGNIALVRMALADQLGQGCLDPAQVGQLGAYVGKPLRGQFRRLAAMGPVFQFQKLPDLVQAEPSRCAAFTNFTRATSALQ